MAYIKVEKLSLSFGEKNVLNSISHRFDTGITVLHGESGAGKTTLLHAVAGIYKAYSGKITLSPDSKIVYCLQEDLFFNNLTVEENMYLQYTALENPPEDEQREIRNTLSLFGIEDLLSHKTKTLSGGERQRLKMAMVALSDPDIILLDEPTAKLDNENINGILKVIEQVWNGKTILIVTHDSLSFSKPVMELYLRGGRLS